ncbi:hypothetical protein EGK14_07725 [Erwinia sp. 198]|nr:hypothetical protein EGK14_07725 [Erwinia sp. 198]
MKPAFEEAWRTLRGTEQQAKAKDVYDIRKSELEPAPRRITYRNTHTAQQFSPEGRIVAP